ncbi:SigE family RNA polymerase sigma factor [Luedemannella flava]|uniref:SigE family RNA polymerase sigma factor n=1 Tax=Luedemannella flava TaxID=349316 RepID=UPI0031D3285C
MTYDEFARSRLAPLLRYAVMLTGDPHLAEDLVQETLVRVQLKWRRVSRADVPDLYVRRMLTNAYLDWRRGRWVRHIVLGTAHREEAVADHAERGADRDEMWQLLATLPRRQRAALVLRYYEDLADAQVAEVLGCAVGTVRAHISRALATLREQLQDARQPVGTAGGGR